MGRPLRRLAQQREPAVDEPTALAPGDLPPVAGRILVLYDGTCGICLHGRDLLARLDRRGALAHDTIQRHTDGLLAAVDPIDRLETWHVVLPSGERLDRGAAALVVLEALPATRLLARLGARAPGAVDRAYRWFAAHRVGISGALGLQHHPDRQA